MKLVGLVFSISAQVPGIWAAQEPGWPVKTPDHLAASWEPLYTLLASSTGDPAGAAPQKTESIDPPLFKGYSD